MNEEELFCKLFPEYVVNGKPLSPYFDLFESGYEQAENRIAELKLKLEALEGQTPWKDIKDKSELIKKNAELKTRNQELLQSCEGATMMYKDLQKTKELLTRFVTASVYFNGKETDLVEEAEQFLKE